MNDYSDNPLRGASGAYLTQGLFYEFKNNKNALWTLRPEPIHGIESMYQVYMDSVDEYDFVMKTVKNMSHFRKLCALDWFMEGWTSPNGSKLEGLKHWREDMRQRDEYKAKKLLEQAAEDGSVPAMRALHDTAKKGKEQPVKQGKGRPSKDKEESRGTKSLALQAFEELEKKRKVGLDA